MFGTDAFSSVNDAIAAVSAGGTVVVNAGTYGEAVKVTRRLTMNLQEGAIRFGSLDDTVSNATLNLNGITLTTGDDSSTRFDSTLAGTGGLTKVGSGTFTLAERNTYAGTTTIDAGTLGVAGSLAGPVTLTGGTLSGAGVISGAVTATGGSVAPGNSPGTLKTGDLDLESGATFSVEIQDAGRFDQIDVTGAVVINDAVLSVTGFGIQTINAGDQFVIISNDGTDAVTGGLFHDLPEGALISTNFLGSGLSATITYKGGSGNNDVVIVMAPATVSIAATTGGNEEGRRRRVHRVAILRHLDGHRINYVVSGSATSGSRRRAAQRDGDHPCG